jgi:hypothetical protein
MIAAGAGVIALVAGHYWKNISSFSLAHKRTIADGKTITLRSIASNDSDGDGVPDWEESLWGTDPEKADTNGDGISDGVEIAQKKQELRIKNQDAGAADAPTETAKFSQDLFATIASLAQSGNLNQEAIDALSQKIGENLPEMASLPDVYRRKDLAKVNDSDDNRRVYFATMKKITLKYSDLGTEQALLAKESQDIDTNTLADIGTIGDSYVKVAAELSKMNVPNDVIFTHLDLINSYAKTGKSLQSLSNFDNDPLANVSILLAYTTYSNTLYNTLTRLENYFTKHGIFKAQ